MAASTYLLELQQRRHKLILDLVDCLGFVSGSVEHELAAAYAERSVTHHSRLDAQEKQVEQTVCSVAEKLVMHGRVAQASRLLLLASRLSKNLIRLDGHRSVNPQAAAALVPTLPPLEHPHAVLSLLLALSGSQSSSAKEEPCPGRDQPREQSSSAFAAGSMLDLSKFAGDSSRLWSSDSSSSSEEREEKEGSSQVGLGSSQVHDLDGDADLQDWLQAFKSDGISDSDGSSAHTSDDEGYATNEGEVFPPQHERSAQVPAQPPPEIEGCPTEKPRTPPRRPIFRHKYGARCAGADIRSLACVAVDEVVPFIRPCQTLEACQSAIPAGLPRRRSVPEAEVARAALHMLQGLPGDTFVLMQEAHELNNDCASRKRGFALSASAKRDLAVASLSPLALAGILEEFIRLGNVAEYLRAFVADAEELPTATASRKSPEERKHGNTMQVFVACVKRHLEAFEDAIAQRDRKLYLRQRGLYSQEQSAGVAEEMETVSTNRDRLSDESKRDGAVSGETLLGLLSLLRPVSESLKFIVRLVEVTVGSWLVHPPVPHIPLDKSVGSLRERTGLLLAALYDSLVSDALLRRTAQDPPRPDDGALAPWRRGWHLNVFLEVLAPYLRLIDSWITEGRLLDPHDELFFSQTGGGSGFGECIDESTESHGLGVDTPVQIGRDLESESVGNMWGTRIVLHSKALPPFLAPLASAVAMAGHDVSLMRKARALIDSTPRDAFEGVERAANGRRKSWPSRTSPELGRESENLSLTTKLFDSLGRLAARIHLANARWNVDERESFSTVESREGIRPADAVDTSVENCFDIEGDSDSSGEDTGLGTEDEPVVVFDDAEKADSRVIGDSSVSEDFSGKEEEKGEDWDFSGRDRGLRDFGVDELTNEGQTSVAAPAAAASKSESESEELQGQTTAGAVVADALEGGHGAGEAEGEASQPESHTSAPQSLAAPLSAGSQGNALSSSTLESYIDRPGFFWGTAQLALSPYAMLRKPLHPAIAPPSCLSILSGGTGVSGMFPERRGRKCGREEAGPVNDDRVQLEKSVASAADAVAEVLPPSVVLESCVLSPLREHCRLTSSSCLGVFVEELEIVKIAGVLRAVYLCPSGAARHAPLSDFRAGLFRLLGSLPSRARVDSRAVALSDGMRVVRDAAALLQDGRHLTSMLQLSLTVEERSLDEGELDATNQDGLAEESNDEICKRLRLPIVGIHRPLAEHFVVQSRKRTVRGWTEDRNQDHDGESKDGEAGSTFPFTVDRQSVDLRVFSSFQVECRLPWPFSVVLPPRSMDKYNCILGLILKIDFTVHALEESHTLHRRGQRHEPTATLKLQGLDTLHLQQTRLAAFLFVAKAVRRYVVSQASIKSWSEFVTQVPRCGSLRGFIRLHEAYLDLIRERCFLLPRDQRALEYLLDALQAGVAFSQRYREYVSGLDAAGEGGLPGGYLQGDTRQQEARESARKSLGSLDELWRILFSALGFFIPMLKEMIRSRRGVHVNELLMDLIFNDFFEFAWSIRGNHVASRVATRPGEANVSLERVRAQEIARSEQ